jgi:leucyl/phenylalanyl-tRNA---protein transferase
MTTAPFPDPHTHDFSEWVLAGEHYYDGRDIISIGVPLTEDTARAAYRMGIFPWHIDGMPLPWFCPARRAVLEFDKLHVPRSLAKVRRRAAYSFTIDRDFRSVIRMCAVVSRRGQRGTWITPDFIRVFSNLHNEGMAHSVEVWNAAGTLVGGLYGIDAGGVFCGESMFQLEPNTSKLALLFLIDHLRSRGSEWLDAQVMTPHLQALGAIEIPRWRFLQKLAAAQLLDTRLFGTHSRPVKN